MLAQQSRLEAELRRVAHPRALELDGARRGPHLARLVAVAVRDHIPSALIPSAPEELGHLVLERLLQDQPRTEATDRLHWILLLADTGQHVIQL